MLFDESLTKVTLHERESRNITLRVGSYNIKHGIYVNLDFAVIDEDIKSLELDIIGFQEIDKCTTRVDGMDTPQIIAEALGFEHYYFTKAINYRNGEYGTLIVSRYPITYTETIAFPHHKGYEMRTMGYAVINVDGISVDFYNTHLSFETQELITEQFGVIADTLEGRNRFIVTGDFNTGNSSYFDSIADSKTVNSGQYATFPSSSRCIDNIVIDSGWATVDSGMGPEGHSDHRLLWAEIKCTETADYAG